MRAIIRTDGTRVDLERAHSLDELRRIIGAEILDTVVLRALGTPRLVMLLDDQGHDRVRPINGVATKLYHLHCREGTMHPIVGDVAIVPDADFTQEAS